MGRALVGEKLPFSINQDDKVLHKVVLSDFAISKFKVINSYFSVYVKATEKDTPPVNILVKDYPSLVKEDYLLALFGTRLKIIVNG